MLKKTALAIFSVVVSGSVWAGTIGPSKDCSARNVVVPCEMKRWGFGVQGLYLQPIFHGFPDTVIGPDGSFRQLNARWGGAYRLEGSYYRGLGNDITMTYLHFHNGTHRPGALGLLPPLTTPIPFNWGLHTRFDQVNLTMGQHAEVGCGKHVHLYGGLQYARFRVDSNNWTLVSIPTALGFTSFDLRRNIDYNGLGPVVGIDSRYNLPYGFSLGANGAGSILFGTSRYDSALVATPSGVVTAGLYSSKKSIVPSLEAKLKLNYTCELPEGLINIEGGYQMINYFNLPSSRWPLTLFSVNNDASFGLHGPYAGVKWVGQV